MKDGTTHTRKQCTSQHTFPGVLGVSFLYVLLPTTALGSWVSVAEARLRRSLGLLILSLLVSAAWIPPVGAQPTLVKDINLLPQDSFRSGFAAIGNVVYFAAYDESTGSELWRSDGTAAGTVLVKDIWPGSFGSYPFSLTNVNGVLYFRAYNGVNGYELWRSNGTAASTVLVKDIWPGSESSSPSNLTNVNGVLYWGADNGVHGRELWRLAP